jgi:enamine deaminase RidA (YjgF/YER057c/UK114 family)
VRKSPEEAQAAVNTIQGVFDQVQMAMDATGLGMTELRDLAINKSIEMGISVQEAFAAIAGGTISTMQAATDAVSTTATAATEAANTAATSIQTGYEKAHAAVESAQRSLTSAMGTEYEEQAKLALDVATQTAEAWRSKMSEVNTSVSTSADVIRQRMGDAVRDVSDRFADMRFDVPVNFTGQFDLARSAEESDIEQFQHGSGGLRNFGSGTLAMLHGPEAVVTEEQIANLVRGGASMSGSGATNLVLRDAGVGRGGDDHALAVMLFRVLARYPAVRAEILAMIESESAATTQRER